MDWRIKASLQKVFSAFKAGDKLNHLGSRLMNPNYMGQKIEYHIDEALIHLEKLNQCGYRISEGDVFLELGTGYAIVESLTMILLGASKVITVDITRDIKFKESLRYVNMFTDKHIKTIADKSFYTEREIIEKLETLRRVKSLDEFLEKAGIVYIAPYDLSDLKPYYGQIKVYYSQVVLEHVPEPIFKDIFIESKKVLMDGGYHSHIANLTDHFRNPGLFRDNSITDINFLKYSDNYWNSWCGNDIAYVNRLRFPYYVNLFKNLGFEILDIDKQKEKDRMNELLSYEEIHNDIKSLYNKDELMDTLWVQRFHIICRNIAQ
jgi:hypothetical protein